MIKLILGIISSKLVFHFARKTIKNIQNVEMMDVSIYQYIIIYSIHIGVIFKSTYQIKNLIIYILLICICMVLLVIDIVDSMTMLIPNSWLCILTMFISCHILLESNISIKQRLIGMVIISVPMLLINRYWIEAFGGGDIKLITLVGYWLGYEKIVVVMIIAIFTGGVYAFFLLYIKKINAKRYIPFAPFLCKSIIVVIFYGESIIHWYFLI